MTRAVVDVLTEVKALAVEFHALTGKPLGVTGEIAEFEAARLLGLALEGARNPGYDAKRVVRGRTETVQIKGRWKREPGKWGRMSAINTGKPFDVVVLVLLTGEDYSVHEIWEAPRAEVVKRLDAPGSKARNQRRSLSVSQFKTIAERVWPVVD